VTDSQSLGGDPFSLGVNLLVDFSMATEVYGLDFLSDAAGMARAPAPLPNNPLLVGKVFYGQGLFAWPSGPCSPSTYSLSTSDAIALTILP
jgi:hypothetical protein